MAVEMALCYSHFEAVDAGKHSAGLLDAIAIVSITRWDLE
jgi:hypothetical protein